MHVREIVKPKTRVPHGRGGEAGQREAGRGEARQAGRDEGGAERCAEGTTYRFRPIKNRGEPSWTYIKSNVNHIPGHALHENVHRPFESKTRTYHGRVRSGRPAGRPGGVGQDWVPTEVFAQETQVPCTPQGVAETSLERLSRSTNKRNSRTCLA